MFRIGIDLSATRCHLIQVRSGRRAPHWPRAARASDTRVLAFETIQYGWSDPGALSAALRRWLTGRKRGRHAAVTLWGVPSAHRLMVVPTVKPNELNDLAQREAAADVPLLQQTEVISGIHAGAMRGFPMTSGRRELIFAAASAPDIRSRIQPLIEVGFIIDAVLTPPLALCSIARLRPTLAPGLPVALLALGSTTTALAIVRDGLLLLAREMPWGYDALGTFPAGREQLAGRVAAELRRSLVFFKQSNRTEIGQIMLCGDTSELRALTAPLILALDLEVETLDSLEGIDSSALPEPADLFRERVANFRLAWAVAADTEPPINLVPPEVVHRPTWTRRRIAAISGIGTALIALVAVAYLAVTPRSTPERMRATASPSRTGPDSSRSPTPAVESPQPDEAVSRPEESPVGPPDAIGGQAAASRPREAGREGGRAATAKPEQGQPERSRGGLSAGEAGRSAPAELTPVVRSVLYSAERRAAIVDNRIVGIGDQLPIGRIIDIEPDAVIVQTARGERRRLTLRPPPGPSGR